MVVKWFQFCILQSREESRGKMGAAATFTVKEIPGEIHETLKRIAEQNGQSLNSYVISILTPTAEERNRRVRMREGRNDYAKFLASLPQVSNSVDLLRAGRD